MSHYTNRTNLQELPFYGQTYYDIELTFKNAKTKIIEKMEHNEIANFIKENKFHELCNSVEIPHCAYYDEDMFIAKQLIAGRNLNIFSMNVRSLPKT